LQTHGISPHPYIPEATTNPKWLPKHFTPLQNIVSSVVLLLPRFFLSLSNTLIAVCGNYSFVKTLGWLVRCFNKPSCYHRPQSLASRHAIDTQTACFKTTCTELVRTTEQRYRLNQEMWLSAVIWNATAISVVTFVILLSQQRHT
jgi:uncharacterized membrane protein